MRARCLGGEDSLEEDMATHSSTLAWEIPWTEEPGRLQSLGLPKVGHYSAIQQEQQHTLRLLQHPHKSLPSVNQLVNGSCESSSEQASQFPGPWFPHLGHEMLFLVPCVLAGMEAWDRRLPKTRLAVPLWHKPSLSREGAPRG